MKWSENRKEMNIVLDLSNGGLMCSGLDAVEFFEMLAAGEDIDIDAKTP